MRRRLKYATPIGTQSRGPRKTEEQERLMKLERKEAPLWSLRGFFTRREGIVYVVPQPYIYAPVYVREAYLKNSSHPNQYSVCWMNKTVPRLGYIPHLIMHESMYTFAAYIHLERLALFVIASTRNTSTYHRTILHNVWESSSPRVRLILYELHRANKIYMKLFANIMWPLFFFSFDDQYSFYFLIAYQVVGM